MADPLSIFVSAAAAIRVLCNTTTLLYTFVESSIVIDQSVQDLLDEFNSLKNVVVLIKHYIDSAAFRDQTWLDGNAQELVAPLEYSLTKCTEALEKFRQVLVKAKSTRLSLNLFRQPITQLKPDLRSSRMVLLRKQIAFHSTSMQLGLQTMNM
jgi:hypothetical protein